MTIGMLEAKATFAEIDLARDARVDHPLQRAVDGRAADAVIFAFDEIDEIVSAEVSLLAEEHGHDVVPLARPLGAGRPQAIEVRQRSGHEMCLRNRRCLGCPEVLRAPQRPA